jgi:GT2 family glycosyltransferase
MKVLVSLINYNSKDYILSCLKDIFAQETTHDFSVVVFDNDSPDRSADEIKKMFPKVHLIKNDKNLGFGKAHNLVAKEFIDDFDAMLLVNPDITFEKDTFEKMFTSFSEEKKPGLLSGKIYKTDHSLDSNGGDYPFGMALFNWLFNLEFLGFKTNFHRNEPEYFTKKHSVDWVGGTFLLISNELIEKNGLFNEDYFMYFEDVELSYRANEKGFSVMLDPGFSVIHHSGGSSDNPRYFQWSNEYKNLILFYNKNFSSLSSLFLKILVYISIGMRIVAFGLLGKTKIAKTYMKVIVNI